MAWIVNKPTEWFEARQELRVFMAGFHAVITRSGYPHGLGTRLVLGIASAGR